MAAFRRVLLASGNYRARYTCKCIGVDGGAMRWSGVLAVWRAIAVASIWRFSLVLFSSKLLLHCLGVPSWLSESKLGICSVGGDVTVTQGESLA
jgi:hypothetical protein